MAKVYEEIKKLHTENLFDDLKIVVSILTCWNSYTLEFRLLVYIGSQ